MPNGLRQRRFSPTGPRIALVALVAIGFSHITDVASAFDDGADAKPRLSLDVRNSHLGYTFFHTGGVRYFVTEILLTNQSERDVTVPVRSLSLHCDGVAYPPNVDHPKINGYEFRVNGKSRRFRDLPKTEVLPISAGATDSAWLVYTDLPKTPDIPRMELRLSFEESQYSLDVNAHSATQLALRVERIGPRDSLGLLTIQGTLNTINVGTLVSALDELAARQVSRVVVSFTAEAKEVDDTIRSWLRERSEGNQTGRNFPILPAIVSTIREFHLAELPSAGSSGRTSAHEHDSTAAAVEAALATAYRGLPEEELIEQIEQGHPFAQASALVSGGGELPARYASLLVERTSSDDPLIRRGAFIALGSLGTPAAIAALRQAALDEDESMATIAVECLAASRFASAHNELQALLAEPLHVTGADLVRILARHPRRQWSEHLAILAGDGQTQADPVIRQEALRALGRIGHSELTNILAEALDEEGLRDTAFHLLLGQDDEVSEQIAIEHALARLDEGPPTSQMLQLFDQVRDPRIVPKLMEYLDEQEYDRSGMITTLARIGTAGIDQTLADRYEMLKPNEQEAVLVCLTHLRSSRLVPLAQSAMQSEHDRIFTAATRALGLMSDDQSIEILATQLDQEEDESRISRLAKSLVDIGTHEAARSLQAAKRSSKDEKRALIGKQLLAWQLNSPGGQQYQRASQYTRRGEHETAIKHYTLALKHDPNLALAYLGRGECYMILDDHEPAVADFTSVIERDADLPRVYSNRGHCRLKLEDYEAAAADFRRGVELDPDDGQAVTGLGIALAILGKAEEGIQIIKEADDRFSQDAIYAYNCACVYGRALESIPEDSPSEEQQKLRQQYAKAAIARLEQSLKWGFDDPDFMQADPDLASLLNFESFQRLLRPDDDSERPPQPDADETSPPQTKSVEIKEGPGEP